MVLASAGIVVVVSVVIFGSRLQFWGSGLIFVAVVVEVVALALLARRQNVER